MMLIMVTARSYVTKIFGCPNTGTVGSTFVHGIGVCAVFSCVMEEEAKAEVRFWCQREFAVKGRTYISPFILSLCPVVLYFF